MAEEPRTGSADVALDAVARLLAAGTALIVALVAAGTLLALAAGREPLRAQAPPLDPVAALRDAVAFRPEGFLWLGLLVTVALPAARVALALLGFLREGDRRSAVVSLGILVVLAVSLALALGTTASGTAGVAAPRPGNTSWAS